MRKRKKRGKSRQWKFGNHDIAEATDKTVVAVRKAIQRKTFNPKRLTSLSKYVVKHMPESPEE